MWHGLLLHTRGSTYLLLFATKCPATRTRGARTDFCDRPIRLPRTRGDRPCPQGISRGPVGLPHTYRPSTHPIVSIIQGYPHTRGSTRFARKEEKRERGYPAHAGIDLLVYAGILPTLGYPAHAGIDRLTGDGRLTGEMATRTRGDRPITRGI